MREREHSLKVHDNISGMKKIFSILIPMLPVLGNYSIQGLPGSLSDMAAIFLACIVLLAYARNPSFKFGHVEVAFIPYLFVVIMSFFFYAIIHFDINEVFTDYLRQFVFFFIVIFGMKKCGDVSVAVKSLEVLSIGTSIYCWMQLYFMQAWKIYLPSYLPFFQHHEILDQEANYLNYVQYYRPHSIFTEPSIFCEYLLVYLAILVFGAEGQEADEKNRKRKLAKKVFITGTCLITGSTTGILGVAAIWAFHFLLQKRDRIKVRAVYFLVVPILLAGFCLIAQNATFSIFWKRSILSNSAASGRFGNIGGIFNQGLLLSLLGRGFAYAEVINEIGWLPGLALVYTYFGAIGMSAIAFAAFSIFMYLGKKDYIGKGMLALFFVMNVGSYPLFSSFLLLDLFFVFHSKNFYKRK